MGQQWCPLFLLLLLSSSLSCHISLSIPQGLSGDFSVSVSSLAPASLYNLSLSGAGSSWALYSAGPRGTLSTSGAFPLLASWCPPSGCSTSQARALLFSRRLQLPLARSLPPPVLCPADIAFIRNSHFLSTFVVSVFRDDQPLPLCSAKAVLESWNSSTSIDALPQASNISGVVYSPAEARPAAAIVAFGGSEGGLLSPVTAAGLAEDSGIPVFNIAYFGCAGVPAKLDLVPVEYFERAIRYAMKVTGAPRVGVHGISRGGEAALLISSLFPDLVSFTAALVPSPFVWPGSGLNTSAWSIKGAPVPFMDVGSLNLTSCASIQHNCFIDTLNAAPNPLARIPVEQITGGLFLLGGEDDKVWPSAMFVRDAYNAATNAKSKYKRIYSGSGHGVASSSPGYASRYILAEGGDFLSMGFAVYDWYWEYMEVVKQFLS